MKHYAAVASLAAVAVVAFVDVLPANSAVTDHLRCRRVREALPAEALVDVQTLPFGLQEGCSIQGAVREVCDPVTEEIVEPSHPDAPQGEALDGERLCYRIRCRGTQKVMLEASDRFGTRAVELGESRRICVPVAKAE